ncbi:hypothetical protein EVAR_53125_1 [Eumeta japonica]|uniref:Uncharacterized protein n=1 Tax=Eumeta variegata TaxID=151549 RepID=A0A4C1Y9U0_EUMVA|nr:hypothetical protein EVAR_53125_1 [Eumeta japonica]
MVLLATIKYGIHDKVNTKIRPPRGEYSAVIYTLPAYPDTRTRRVHPSPAAGQFYQYSSPDVDGVRGRCTPSCVSARAQRRLHGELSKLARPFLSAMRSYFESGIRPVQVCRPAFSILLGRGRSGRRIEPTERNNPGATQTGQMRYRNAFDNPSYGATFCTTYDVAGSFEVFTVLQVSHSYNN